ncbi:hypothetical protein H0H81_008669 [Sphagnurus paluster]|uniref:Uncharacterized protein n=1 Tax=Sphagnurus paluster TaxID=117069 RepID=A0A9P7K4L2_9AGAR|nr:hypothetical protein H0H81_008669 [Sphagnurus paluster]
MVTTTEIDMAARTAIATLKTAGVPHACFVGGMACKLLGNTRRPNVSIASSPNNLSSDPTIVQDLDILCLTSTWTQEALKQRLVALDAGFYLIAARSPLATYKVLWYRLPVTDSRVKVDLLFPGVMNIPVIPPTRIITPSTDAYANRDKLRCAPPALVLLLKLQAWQDHRDAFESRFWGKQYVDADDLMALLPVVCAMGVDLRKEMEMEMLGALLALSLPRVERFMLQVPSSRAYWETLGLVQKVEEAKEVEKVTKAEKAKKAEKAEKAKKVTKVEKTKRVEKAGGASASARTRTRDDRSVGIPSLGRAASNGVTPTPHAALMDGRGTGKTRSKRSNGMPRMPSVGNSAQRPTSLEDTMAQLALDKSSR